MAYETIIVEVEDHICLIKLNRPDALNALNLELRCYIPSMDYYLSAQTALHDAIYEKFNAAGISIAFPQRDVHLDTARPIVVRLQT